MVNSSKNIKRYNGWTALKIFLTLALALSGCLQQPTSVSAQNTNVAINHTPTNPSTLENHSLSTEVVPITPTISPTDISTAPAYYVGPNGLDTNPGTLNSPWKTLTYAVSQLHAGDTLYMMGGTYREHFYVDVNGLQNQPIVISNYNNEEVIFDGTNINLTDGSPLFGINGSWINVSNLTVQYSKGAGITVRGAHVTLDNIFAHHNWGSGVLLSGNYDVIQNSRIWYNSVMNENGTLPTAWASGVSCARYPDYCTIRKTTVWNNWGEGISSFEALHTTIEDNISYNNQINIYVSDTKYSITQRNLLYCTRGNPIDVYTRQIGIYVGDEKGVPIPLGEAGQRFPSSNNTFLNNLILRCGDNIAFVPNVSSDNLFAYNTFVNSGGSHENINVKIYSGSGTNIRFINNLILQEDDNLIGVNDGSGVIFENNLWSKTPPSDMVGAGMIIGDPKLAKTGNLAPGELTAAYFRLLPTSAAIDRGIQLSDTSTDYFLDIRGKLPDIGADESNPVTLLPRLFLPSIRH